MSSERISIHIGHERWFVTCRSPENAETETVAMARVRNAEYDTDLRIRPSRLNIKTTGK